MAFRPRQPVIPVVSAGYPSTLTSSPQLSRVHLATRFPGAPGLNRACPLQAVYSDMQENPRWSPRRRWGGAGRDAQARWAPGWAEEAP